MLVDVGSRLGAYEITALIGEGGMGRVFRAHDTRLKRDVAIKAIRPEIAADADLIARFRREAEALAALNHPHIAGIHDVLESDGSQFLVLEMVEGDTLADRIARGPIAIAEALAIAMQIAQALEGAHARGIVHRDLKPANVKITPDGLVKVLDFGLAKGNAGETTNAPSLTQSPTITLNATAGGVILGTASYMSPEQARGQTIDAQSDLWALGCVLYEMLAGRRAFSGSTVTDVLAAVVRGEPEWSRLPPDTPAAVRTLLRRCLEKHRARRLHHVADVRIEIEDVLANPTATKDRPANDSRRAAVTRAIAAALLVIAAALAGALVLARRSPVPAPEMRVEITTPPSPEPTFLAISPDGRMLVFVGGTDSGSRLWVRSLAETAARPLEGTELATAPFWSPDSRSIGFFADGKLKRLDLSGGITRTLATAPMGNGGTWNRDGVIVFTPSAIGPLFRVSAGGGEAVELTRLADGQTGHRFPHFLPDNRHFLFLARGTPGRQGIFVGSIDGTPMRHVVEANTSGVLAASGDLLFVRQETLLAQPFNASTHEVFGEPVPITDRVAVDGSLNSAAITASAAGPIAYRPGGASGQRQLTWFDRTGRKVGEIGIADTTALLNPELSPDGRSVALNRTVESYHDIWQIEVARSVFRRFTFDPLSDQIPVWSPDGQRIVFGSNRVNGIYDLYVKAANSPDPEQLLLASPQNKFPMGFSRDGRFLLYRNTSEGTNWDLWALPFDGAVPVRKPFPVVQTSFQEQMGELSPDGRWIAYQTNESGRYEVYVQSFPQAGARTQVSTGGGSQPRWRPDGAELFYMGLDSRLMAATIAVDARGQLHSASPVGLFLVRTPGGPVPSPQKQQYAVSPDGQRFLVNSLTDEATTSPITLILNWAPPTK
jgi:Tol biopolymer transport system component